MTTNACVKASAIFLVAVFAVACGGAESGVRAINLQSGQQQDFATEGEVPPGWGVCPEDDCSTLPGVPCQNLGQAVCSATPGCELVQLGCVVDGCPAAPEGEDVPDCLPSPPRCDYACMPEGEKSCEQLTDEQACTDKVECAWDTIMCAAMCAAPGDDCPPCPETGVCRTKTPDSCDALDATRCLARPDCEWTPQVCPAIACAPDQPDCAVDCDAFCRSKDTTHCIAIGMPEPFCENGHAEPKYDSAGCVIGYECVDECPAVEFLAMACEDGSPGVPTFDERGCVTGFTCPVECPAIAMVAPDCENGAPVPSYDDRGCLTGYTCQECPAIPMLYPDCQDGSQPVASYDENGCLTGYTCQTSCPPMPEIAIDCAPDSKAVPTYDSAGCQTGFRCVPL